MSDDAVLYRLLQLGEDATEADAAKALEGILQRVQTLEDRVLGMISLRARLAHALGLGEDATDAELSGTAEAMRLGHEGAAELSKKVVELERVIAAQEAEALVDEAVKAGKVTPAQRQWALDYALADPAAFSVFVQKAPVVLGGARTASGMTARQGLDEFQRHVNGLLGIGDSRFREFAAKQENG